MYWTIQLLLDIAMFKLSFHTYEALTNKERLKKASVNNENQAKTMAKGKQQYLPPQEDDDLDLVSNMSGESTQTTGGPPGPAKARKIQLRSESNDVKLNDYLKKWMVIVIFYQCDYLFRIGKMFLPAVPLIKLGIGMWILLPQCKGEFFVYHLIAEYLLQFERVISELRCRLASILVKGTQKLALYVLNNNITFISAECIVLSQECQRNAAKLLREEVEVRDTGEPLVITEEQNVKDFKEAMAERDEIDFRRMHRDSYIRQAQSNYQQVRAEHNKEFDSSEERMQLDETNDLVLNQTLDFNDLPRHGTFQHQMDDPRNQTMTYERGSLEQLQSADVRLPPSGHSNQYRPVPDRRKGVGQGLNPNVTQAINSRDLAGRDQLNHSVNLGSSSRMVRNDPLAKDATLKQSSRAGGDPQNYPLAAARRQAAGTSDHGSSAVKGGTTQQRKPVPTAKATQRR